MLVQQGQWFWLQLSYLFQEKNVESLKPNIACKDSKQEHWDIF